MKITSSIHPYKRRNYRGVYVWCVRLHECCSTDDTLVVEWSGLAASKVQAQVMLERFIQEATDRVSDKEFLP